MFNILNNYINQAQLLKNDLIEFHINLSGIAHFFEVLLLVTCLFFTLHQLGEKIRKKFIVFNEKNLSFFINIALGYILVGTGVCLLGILSLLTREILAIYIIMLLFIAFYPFSTRSINIPILNKKWSSLWKKHVWTKVCITIIIFSVFLRLLPPDIGADGIAYRTGYPRIYLANHTMMLEAKGTENFIAIPQLGEMLYVITEFLGFRDASKFIHFTFYLLIVLLLWQVCKLRTDGYNYRFAALFFASSPLVIHIAPSAYTDFPGIFCFVLSVIILAHYKQHLHKTVIVSAILYGGALATKFWFLIFFPAFILYLWLTLNKKSKSIKTIFLFLAISFLVASPWYLRSALIPGERFYFASKNDELAANTFVKKITYFLQYRLSDHKWLLKDFIPLAFIGIIYLVLKPTFTFRMIKRSSLILALVIFTCVFLIYPTIFTGRYMIPTFIFIAILSSVGFSYLVERNNYFKYILGFAFGVTAVYYFLNSALILPYGIGLANQHNYATRKFTEDFSVYYDFNNAFSEKIDDNETVAVNGLIAFYYADFSYRDISYFIDNKQRMFIYLKKHNINKLLMRGEDIKSLCKRLADCREVKFTLLASYAPAKQYLYKVNY